MKDNLKILFVCEDEFDIIDEGKKKIAYNFLLELKKTHLVYVYAKKGNERIQMKEFRKNIVSVLINICKYIMEKKFEYDYIFYFPSGSILNYRSHFYSKLIRKICSKYNKKVKLLFFSFQEKQETFFRLLWLRIFKPDKLICFTNNSKKIEKLIGNRHIVKIISGADTKKFFPISEKKKQELRKKYKMPLKKTIILHVGHAVETRGINDLFKLAKKNKDYFIVLILSSLYKFDILNENENAQQLDNIKIINHFISDIDEYYKLADLYIFPSKIKSSAIDFPLSIVEALACGVAVASRKFGVIHEYKKELKGVVFFNKINEIPRVMKKIKEANLINKKLPSQFSWDKIVKNLLTKI